MSNTSQTINPRTAEVLATHHMMEDGDVEAAIRACHRAFQEWRTRRPEERAEVLGAIGEALMDHQEPLADLMTAEMGKLLRHSLEEVENCAAICRWTAEAGPGELASEERDLGDGQFGIIEYAPVGVIYGIQPWNYPAYQVVRYSIANLMAGNGVLLKPALSVLGTARKLEEIYRDGGLPEGLFTVLAIDHEQSDRVIENDLVRGVTLTGSPDAGSAVGEVAGRCLKKAVLELGSNDAYLVLADADVQKAVEICVKGRIYNNGETCIAAKRFVVAEDIYDEFTEAFVGEMKSLKSGDPRSEETDLGPMAREDLREKLQDQVDESVKNGVKILCGGSIPEGPGYHYPATVLAEVAPGQPAYDDELFGPVASIIRAKDEADAMRIANDSRFGLGGGIITGDTERAKELALESFDTGMVFINGFGLAHPKMPFGGVKDSGFGREHGGYGMKEFVNAKAVMLMGG